MIEFVLGLGILAAIFGERRKQVPPPEEHVLPPLRKSVYRLDWNHGFHTVDRINELVGNRVADIPGQRGAGSVKVYFKPGEPQTLSEYAGQEHIVDYLRDALAALSPTECALEPQIFLGAAGTGKTLLAKVVANELKLRAEQLNLHKPLFIEAFPADMPDVEALDALMRRVVDNPGSVVFIDEIHDLMGPHSRKLYLVLEEQRYQFKGDATPTKLPPVTLLAATTDYGMLHAALKRRWIKHMFKPATEEQLLGYVMRRAFPITEAAAKLIVSRTKFSGAPWEALELYRMAATGAKGTGSGEVTEEHVQKVFDRQGVDELGLHWIDRMVIKALLSQPRSRQWKGKPQFVCYAASESNTCTLAGVDKEEYRTAIRPKLMSRKLLEAKPYYGQALTERAVELYGNLKDA